MTETNDDKGLDVLLEYLKRTRGFDFTGYKRANVTRRVQKRMQAIRIPTYADYVDYLEVHPDEFVSLFNTILINVTAFFRDPEHWEFLREEIVPRIVKSKPPGAPIRVWVPGCASGEEAFTIAMALAEAVGLERYRESVKIYATDADEEALAKARQATYTLKEIAGVPEELAEKYFEPNGHTRTIIKELRRGVIFGRHNLVQDAPISRADLISCRNTLMYFNADTQARILARFHYALNDGGFLFVGKAEMLFTHGNTFVPVDLRRRVFVKVPRAGLRDRLLIMAEGGDPQAAGRVSTIIKMRDASFDTCPVAQLIVDAEGNVAMVNELARSVLGLMARDVGRPLQDLEISYRPVELRSLMEQAQAESRTITRSDVTFMRPGAPPIVVDVEVSPLMETGGVHLGTAFSFHDVTRYKRLQVELQEANQELEAAYEELQSTSEELETTNEELQSTVEEL
jgi:two-component system CheB/CheR fusion protein